MHAHAREQDSTIQLLDFINWDTGQRGVSG